MQIFCILLAYLITFMGNEIYNCVGAQWKNTPKMMLKRIVFFIYELFCKRINIQKLQEPLLL